MIKKLNRNQKLLAAFACVAGLSAVSVYAEGTTPDGVITAMTTSVKAVIDALLVMIGTLILAATTLWLVVLAYKRGRASSKSVAS